MGNFKVTGYVVTGLVESNDSATYVVVYGIRDDEKQAKELFERDYYFDYPMGRYVPRNDYLY